MIGQFGKVVQTWDYHYELDNSHWPHDKFYEADWQTGASQVSKVLSDSGQLIISNRFWDGYSGHEVEFIISENNEIVDIKYSTSSHIEDESEENFTVEKVILFLQKDKHDQLLAGHYSLLIFEEEPLIAGELNRQKTDYCRFQFDGKFKFYTDAEVEIGFDSLQLRALFQNNDLSEDGVCHIPDVSPKFMGGQSKLENLVREIIEKRKFSRSLFAESVINVSLNEDGVVDIESIKVYNQYGDEFQDGILLAEDLSTNERFISSWLPGMIYNRRVKTIAVYGLFKD